MDPTHKHHPLVMHELKNKVLNIGTIKPKYKWTYCEQYFWVNNPKYVIIMDDFNNELKYFIKNVIGKECDNIKINKKNFTIKTPYTLSLKSIIFLKKIYKNDILLYKTYKNMHITERLIK